MKFLFKLILPFLIINIVIFIISNYFLDQRKEFISKKITYETFCDPTLSSIVKNELSLNPIPNDKIYKAWDLFGGYCKGVIKNHTFIILFKDENSENIFYEQLNANMTKKSIHDYILYKLDEFNKALLHLEDFKIKSSFSEQLLNQNTYGNEPFKEIAIIPASLTSAIIKLKKRIQELNEINFFITGTNYEIIKLVKVLDVKKISNFKLKFSFIVSCYLYIIFLFLIYLFRNKQLGFYR